MPRNAGKFMGWSTGSSGARSASGRKRAQDSEKVLNLIINHVIDFYHEPFLQVLPVASV